MSRSTVSGHKRWLGNAVSPAGVRRTLREATEQQLPRSVSAQRSAAPPRGDRAGDGAPDDGPPAGRRPDAPGAACVRRMF